VGATNRPIRSGEDPSIQASTLIGAQVRRTTASNAGDSETLSVWRWGETVRS